MPNGQVTADLSSFAGTGFFPGMGGNNTFPGTSNFGATQGFSNNYVSQQSTDGLPQSFPQRPSQEEEHLRQQLAAYARLMDDWIQFTEEKWRTVSDSQLGWKPLRGRWNSWDDIFQDAYAAKTSDPMAQAAQAAGDATARRYDTSKDKGSAASAVACFMRDMMTLRRGLEMMQQPNDGLVDTTNSHAATDPQTAHSNRRFDSGNNGSLLNGATSGVTPRNSLIRRPAQIFVDADSEK
jgi:hypothetical protein